MTLLDNFCNTEWVSGYQYLNNCIFEMPKVCLVSGASGIENPSVDLRILTWKNGLKIDWDASIMSAWHSRRQRFALQSTISFIILRILIIIIHVIDNYIGNEPRFLFYDVPMRP